MSDDGASRTEVVRRVGEMLKAAREQGELDGKEDTEEKILSIARNTCEHQLK